MKWSFKEWLFEYRDPKYVEASKKVLLIIKDSVEKIPPDALSVKDVKNIYVEHNLNQSFYNTIPFIMSARTGDLTYMRMLPKDSEEPILNAVVKWWTPIRKSKHSFPNTFILMKALEAIDKVEAAGYYRKHIPNVEDLDKKWRHVITP